VLKCGNRVLRVLFTCIGRRVTLLQDFRSAAKYLKLKAQFMGTDVTFLSPALQLCDKGFVVPPVSSPGYMRAIADIVKREKINLLIPTIDSDLGVISANREKLLKLGCVSLISSPQVIDTCRDKRKMHDFLVANGFDTPRIYSLKEASTSKKIKFPLFLKPWDGSAGKGNAVVKNRDELKFYSKSVPNCMVQEFVEGTEFTCDAYVDFDMKVRCIVPRMRIAVRGGEVSKGQVIKNRRIMDTTAALVQKLGAGPGVVTIQCFLTGDNRLLYMEMNPRFGGGVVLGIQAGANFPKWILSQLVGKNPTIKFDGFEDKLIMLRYDEQVFIKGE